MVQEVGEPYFEDLWEPDSGGYVITRYRGSNINLRTQLLRILKKAGVEPWERLFHNLRASRETELENDFPSHVVAGWLGNSPAVARRHYLQITEEHFARALEKPVAGSGMGTDMAPSADARRCQTAPPEAPQPAQTSQKQGFACQPLPTIDTPIPPGGLEPPTL